MSSVIITAPTDQFIDALFPPKYDEHMKDWRWDCYAKGNFHHWPKYSNRVVYGSREPS